MSRIFVTGDKHGIFAKLQSELYRINTTKKDVVIILGDHGTLYYGEDKDNYKKSYLNSLPATFICIRGNHDRRPDHPSYIHEYTYFNTDEYAGYFYVDPKYPSILYTTEYGWYRFGSKNVFVIGGAYSVDKFYRLAMQKQGLSKYLWFSDEQLSFTERQQAAKTLMFATQENGYVIMSHTAPLRYKPLENLLPNIDQSTVDESMEIWMNALYDNIEHSKWYCGHWHVDKSVDKMRFMFDDLEMFDETPERITE